MVDVNYGGVGGCRGSGLLMWVCGGGSGGGGQRAVGLVVAWWCRVCLVFFFNGFAVGLWLDICWVCGGFGVMVVAVWW